MATGNGEANGGGRSSVFDNTRLLAATSAIAYGLGMWWMQNTWTAIKDEAHLREQLEQQVAQIYQSKEAAQEAGMGRQRQIELLSAQADRNADRIEDHERTYRQMQEQLSRLEAQEAATRAMLDSIMRVEAGEQHNPLPPPPQHRN